MYYNLKNDFHVYLLNGNIIIYYIFKKYLNEFFYVVCTYWIQLSGGEQPILLIVLVNV